MFVREIIASILAALIFFAPVLIALFASPEPGLSNSWQRGVAMVPVLFIIAVPVTWASGKYLLSRGLRKPLSFSLGAIALAASLVATLVTPAIVIGSVVGLFSWGSAILVGLVVALGASAMSIPAAVAWWWIVAHNHTP